MKKPLARILAVLLALILIGGAAIWWIAAGNAKKAVEDTIARINAMPFDNGAKLNITYAGIATAGFPPNVTVRLTDPKLSATLPSTPSLAAAGESPAPSAPTTIDWDVKGYADIGTHYLDAAYTFTLHGDDTVTITNEAESLAVKGTNSHYRFALKAKSLGDFLNWEKLDPKEDAQVKAFISTIAEISSDIGPLEYVDASTNEPAITQPQGKVRFLNHSDENAFDIQAELFAKDVQIHPAYADKLMKFNMVNPGFAQFGLSPEQIPFQSSGMGKQNIDIAFSAYVTRGDAQQSRTVKVNAPRLSIRNDYYDVSMPFALDILKQVGGTDFKVKTDTRLTLTEKGAAEIRKAQDMFYALTPMLAANQKNMPPETLEALKKAVIEAMPNVSQTSPIVFALDISGNSVAGAQGSAQKKFKANLARFEFSNTNWGLKAEGALDTLADSPAINLTLNCEKCTALVENTVTMLRQMQDAFRLLEPTRPAYPFGEPLQQAVVQFLETAGTKDAAGNIRFAVTTPAANDIRIGEQPLMAVMMQGMTTIAPYMQPVVPAEPAK